MPVFVGGNSPGSEERALRAGTGWAPLHVPGMTDRVRAYVEHAAAEGIATQAIGVAGELSAQLIEDYAEAGAAWWLHYIPMTADEGEFTDELERLVAVRAEYTGAT
jgi:hypothetical protein